MSHSPPYIQSATKLGATYLGEGWWNFAVYSKNPISHLVIGDYQTCRPTRFIPLLAETNTTGDIWHCSCRVGTDKCSWGWALTSASETPLLYALDPYAHHLKTGHQWGKNGWKLKSIEQDKLFCVAAAPEPFNWGEKKHHPYRPKHLVIYEAHVRGFTKDQSSGVQHPGTYLGFCEKIHTLKKMGITAIELLPIFEFDETEWGHKNPITGNQLYNFWGYSPISFFSPMQRYGTTDDPLTTSKELKTLIDTCHREGIAVILDVVYNHTGEGNELGPSYSFKRFDPTTYYLCGEDKQFLNFSGCGNTINANHPLVSNMILDSLHHWITEYRIDGFRFDLASSLTRNQKGAPMSEPSLFELIINDSIINKCLLITEPWDASGLYQTGQLYHLNQTKAPALKEWNDKYRDDVRRFIKGDKGSSGLFATRLCGSEDIYSENGIPQQSINYITAHDGFTLNDLVSYNQKHNEANGEDNRDGMNTNYSWNCGVEGKTARKNVIALRDRQRRNFLVALFLSQGNPMILYGDEVGRTQDGNNNSWCQDAPMNWLQWDIAEDSLRSFIETVLSLRSKSGCFEKGSFLTASDVEWHGEKPNSPEWDPDNHFVACTLFDNQQKPRLYIAFNSSSNRKSVDIPTYQKTKWQIIINTSKKAPQDHSPIQRAESPSKKKISMLPHSSIVLFNP